MAGDNTAEARAWAAWNMAGRIARAEGRKVATVLRSLIGATATAELFKLIEHRFEVARRRRGRERRRAR